MSYNEILDEEWIFVDSYRLNEKSDSLMLADFKSLKTGKFLYAVPYYKFGSNSGWDLKIKLHNQKKEKFILKLTKKQLDRAKNRKLIKNSTTETPFLVFVKLLIVILLIFVTHTNVMLINFYYCRIVEEKNNYEELLKKKII